jgi:hypothetical protein
MPKRVAALNAMQVEKIKSGEELIDGAVPGLRVTKTAAGLSWGLSVRVKGVRRWIPVSPMPIEGPSVFDRTSPTAKIRLRSMRLQSSANGTQ